MGQWVFLVAALVAVSSEGTRPHQDVQSVKLTEDNFQQVLDGSLWILNFCTSTVPDCILLSSAWQSLAAHIDSAHISASLGLVTPQRGAAVFQSFAVREIPAVLVVHNGYVYNYTGPLTPDALVALVDEGLYLMFDRRRVSVTGDFSWKKVIKRAQNWYQRNPITAVCAGLAAFAVSGWSLVYLKSTHAKVD